MSQSSLSPEAVNERLNEENLKLAEALASLPALQRRIEALEARQVPSQEELLKLMQNYWARQWNTLVTQSDSPLERAVRTLILFELQRLNIISWQKFVLLNEDAGQEYTMEANDAV